MMEQSLETFQSLDPKAYLSKFTTSNTRPDARPLHSVRPTTIVPTVIHRNTHGSSLVRLGNTQVTTGISLSVGTPSPSCPHYGELDVTVHLSPLSHGRYTAGGRIQHEEGTSSTSSAIAYQDPQGLESFVKRSLLSSKLVDLKELGLQEGKSAWKVHVSCVVLNHEGNIVDACLLGAVSALLDLRLPLVKFGTKNGKEIVQLLGTDCDQSKSTGTMNDGRKGVQLNLKTIPIPLTVGIFEDKMLVDPTMEEEDVCDGMITVIVDALSLKGDDDIYDGKILGLSKSGEAILKPEDIAACAQLAMGRARELRDILIAK